MTKLKKIKLLDGFSNVPDAEEIAFPRCRARPSCRDRSRHFENPNNCARGSVVCDFDLGGPCSVAGFQVCSASNSFLNEAPSPLVPGVNSGVCQIARQ